MTYSAPQHTHTEFFSQIIKMSVGAEQFREFVLNGPHTGRVRLCVRFTIKPGQVDAFKAEFQPVIDISVKEKGCAQVCFILAKK